MRLAYGKYLGRMHYFWPLRVYLYMLTTVIPHLSSFPFLVMREKNTHTYS